MRRVVTMLTVGVMVGVAGVVDARERPIKELPKDIWDLAFVWTEPLKQVARHSRQSDPVSGLWFGLIDGSVRSVTRTAKFFLAHPDDATSPTPNPKKQFRYSF